ncbi:MAG: carboxypeptidase-like regulatory domain-containing protein [Acidobacteria bacterium]|nr:carboxypeptidase-like regulatory domain-containing protein [Acidobacteriota bacterium]MCA1651959.1 carboxypeptidase-like regulatory domain-containing protein [Acidobacteriota bacterium]
MAPLIAALAIAQAPPRDARPPATGTAVIRGRVLDRETGLPLARVVVSLPHPAGRPTETQTDSQGRYEFAGLPAGRYSVTVFPPDSKAFYLRQTLGDDGPSDVGRRRSKPLELKDGEVREGADIALFRALGIEGRITDAWGEPVSNLEVTAERLDGQGLSGGRPRVTDDRGLFRLFGLPPGNYRVCARPHHFSPPDGAVVKESQVRTCYPDALRETDAQPVTLTAADATGIDIRLQRSRAFSASGIVLDSTGGAAERAQVSIVRIEKSGTSGTGAQLNPGGQFSAKGLAPGEYAVSAIIGGPGSFPPDTREAEVGYLPFRIETSDVEGLVVTMARPAKVAGRVVFEEGWPPARRRPPLTVQVRFDRSTHRPMSGPPPSASVKDDLTFELEGLSGPQVIGLGGYPADEWTLKAIRYRGEEILNIPTEFRTSTDPRALEIVLTNRGARLSGRVTDTRGVAAEDGSALVLIFPASPQEWRPDGNVIGTAPIREGAFRLGPRRPGEYLVLAAAIEDYVMPRDAAGFERLAKVAENVTLLEGDQRTIDLTIVKVP